MSVATERLKCARCLFVASGAAPAAAYDAFQAHQHYHAAVDAGRAVINEAADTRRAAFRENP